MNKVLIIIDAQEDFTRGALRNEDAIEKLSTIHEVVKYAEENEMNIIYTADTHGEDYLMTQEGRNLPVEHCVYRTAGWNICPEVKPEISDLYIVCKESFGATTWNHWETAKKLANAKEIWMCGFCTDICVSANFQILKAMYPETPIIIIEDACAGVSLELHDAAIKVMQSCQARIIKWQDLKNENQTN